MEGLLGGNLKGDVSVVLRLDPQSIIMLFVLIVALAVIIMFLKLVIR